MSISGKHSIMAAHARVSDRLGAMIPFDPGRRRFGKGAVEVGSVALPARSGRGSAFHPQRKDAGRRPDQTLAWQ